MIDWKTNIESGLNNSGIYRQLVTNLANNSKAIEGQQLALVYNCVEFAYQRSKLIVKYMPEYTLHDGDHLFRVLYLMEKIITENRLKLLSSAELVLLILSAFFHDIGMAPLESEIRSWRRDWYKNDPSEEKNKDLLDEEVIPSEEQLDEFEKFHRFQKTFPDKIEEIDRLEGSGNSKLIVKASLIRSYLISEYIRTTHAKRARQIIGDEWAEKIIYQDQDLTSSLADLCFSHNDDAMKLIDFDNELIINDDDTVNLPFIGVVLRLADLLDFDGKRTPSVLFSHLTVRNSVSLAEWEKHRSVKAWTIKPNEITFSAVCSHPAIESSIRKFCDYIDQELKNCNIVLSKVCKEEKYKLELPTQVRRDKIQAKTNIATGKPIYIYRNTSFHLSKTQVIDLLMGTKLYGKPEVALRELIQNSIDACLLSKSLHKNWSIPYIPKIIVKYYSKNNNDFLEVIDNGVGMNQEIIDKYYSNIGSSYYKSKDFYELKASNEIKFKPISRFGIGILSCFMVADSLEVETKRLKDKYDYDEPLKILVEGYDSIFSIYKSTKKEPGTKTKLLLRKSKNPWEKLSDPKFIEAVKKSILKPDIPIDIITDKNKTSYTESDFYQLNASQLKEYYWQSNNNVKEVCFSFSEDGFEGNAIVGLIIKNDKPVLNIEILNETVDVNDESFDLNMEITYDINEIRKNSTSISLDDEGGINASDEYSILAESNSSFSIHGITYPDNIFPDYRSRHKKAMIKWGFPMLLVLDLGGINDLDLNSARNEILYNEKWNKFEIKLASIVCNGIKNELESSFWKKLKEVLLSKSKSENFLIGLKSVE